MEKTILNDVSDTALWVAVYREWETARPDALFKDPLAGRLAGERGKTIEKQMIDSRYVAWSVVIRTHIIDRFIKRLIDEGVDTVINLGAGLDTRPYRLPLPAGFQWIEVDFPKMIALKNDRLAGETPTCSLRRIGLDLSKESERRALFDKLNDECRKAAVLTEGVTPYLSNEDVASLAKDLRAQSNFRYWITDYNSPDLVKRMNRPSRKKQMRNAPFLFNPPDWFQFFADLGWRKREIQFVGEEAENVGRPIPHSWWLKIVATLFVSKKAQEKFKQYNGWVLLEPK